jgi:4-phytase/acid phosphatase/peptide/nickel transport system substrate-binding protein
VNHLLIVALVYAALAGCSPEGGEAVDTRAGGVLYFGIETPFHGFDVLGTSGFINPPMAPLNNLIQEPLFRMDAAGNLVPVLGLSAAASSDGMNWDIQLRQGVCFHDGTAFAADAVVHHWTRILDPDNRYRGRPTFQPIRFVERIDDFTVRFHLSHPWPAFLTILSDELLLFNFIPSPSAVAAGIHDRKPVGTGPYKYHRWNDSDHFVVLRNDDYWQTGKPLLNKVVFRAVPDHQARFASLLAGQLDLITLDRGSLIEKARQNPELYLHHSQGNGAEIVLINTAAPPLDDIRVRRALALANNQQLHIRMVYGDTVPFIQHPFGEAFSCEADGYLAYDPERAKQLIDAVGRPVKIECLHSNTSRGRSIGALLQQLFKEIGVTLTPVALSTGPQVMRVLQKQYQLATWRIPPARDQGPQLYRSFHSQSPTNFSGYHNPELDNLLEMQRVETDPSRRRHLWCDIIRRLNEAVPFIYRGGRRFHIVARRQIRDMMDTPGFMVDLASAWLDEEIKFNVAAHKIEKAAVIPDFDCPDPGDVEATRAMLVGAWKGKDSWGGKLDVRFTEADTVMGTRSGGYELNAKFTICGPTIRFRTKRGTLVSLTIQGDALDGTFERGGYGGTIEMARASAPETGSGEMTLRPTS